MSTATHPGFRPRWSSRPAVWRDGPIGALRRAGVFLGTLLLFVVALVVGVSVHLDTRAARRVAVGEVDAMLASTLRGRIVVERLSGLDLFGVSGADATIYDADGRPVLVARGVDARFATFALLRSLLLDRHGPLVVDLPSVEVASVDVGLDEDRQGKLALAGAFAPRHPSPETPAERPGRGLRLVVGRLALGHGHAHRAAPPGGTAIDADLDGVRGDLLFEPDLLRADLDRASVTARAIAAGADVSGALAAHLNAASPAALGRTDASLSWDGRVGAVANSVRATLAAGKVDAVVDVPEATPEAVRSVWVD